MASVISIIVPVFNAEKYLNNCLNCINKQTYQNFEVILVDDGSSDKSLEVLSEWSEIDGRYRFYHKENGGVSSARNEGLTQSTGDYICFVDADDQLAPTYLEELYRAIGDEVDSSMCGFKKIDLLSHEDCEIVPKKGIESLEENLKGFYDAGSTDWQRYLWNRMFKKSVIMKASLQFREDIYYKEDGLFVVQYLCASNGLVGCVDKVLYYYYRNKTGAMSKTWHYFDKNIISNLKAHQQIIKVIRERKLPEEINNKAIEQAKAACNWIYSIMIQCKSFHLFCVLRIERCMFSILGLNSYLQWRTSQIIKIIK